jgi:hypothetical protein
MADEQAVALYGAVKKMAEAMSAREALLDTRMAALDTAIRELGQLPATLGRQTSQYIAAGVKQSIQDDFSRPIAEAVKGPIADLSRETYHAREVISQVGKESRYQTLGWVAVMIVFGIAIGWVGCYYFFQKDVGRIDDRLDSIQQQIATPQQMAIPSQHSPYKGKGREK